jgi:methyl-accepting chemotaxis protein
MPVLSISVEYADYIGEFDSFERMDDDVLKEATLGDLLGVMKSFDTKAEKLVGILSEMNSTLKDVKDDTSQIKADTGQIKEIKENTVLMKDKLTSLEEIHKEMLDLRMKYNQLSDDVAETKIAISGLGVPA